MLIILCSYSLTKLNVVPNSLMTPSYEFYFYTSFFIYLCLYLILLCIYIYVSYYCAKLSSSKSYRKNKRLKDIYLKCLSFDVYFGLRRKKTSTYIILYNLDKIMKNHLILGFLIFVHHSIKMDDHINCISLFTWLPSTFKEHHCGL